MAKTQEQKRNERAEKVCQEVRYQMAKSGGIIDNPRLYKFLASWMRVAKKNKYERPKEIVEKFNKAS